MVLVLEDKDLMGEERIADSVKVGIWTRNQPARLMKRIEALWDGVITLGGYRFDGYSPCLRGSVLTFMSSTVQTYQ
jgi:hypothetical protein